jgi:PTS system nitrogen regulatory IIA component
LRIGKPSVHLNFLDTPIDFNAPDALPVHVLFLVLSPTVRDHLHLLARLAYALRDPGFKGAVLRQGPDDEILREVRRVETSAASVTRDGREGGAG